MNRIKPWVAAVVFISCQILLCCWPPAARAELCSSRQFDAQEHEVMRAYIAYYGRAADAEGLAYWTEQLAAGGGDLSVIIEPFGVSAEFNDRYAMLDDQSLVENLYRQLFGRDPDAAGLAFYTEELAAGRMTLQTIALNIIYGVQGDDVAVVANRLAASEYFVSCLEQGVFDYPTIPVAVSILSDVSSAPESLATARAGIDGLADVAGNQPPYAGPLSFVADEGIVYIEAQLIGFDPDNDIVSFQLLSPANGNGYTDAYVGSQSGRLYLTLDGSSETVEVRYNVSDGQLFSEPASLVISVAATEDKGTGAEEVDAATYASFDIVRPWGHLLGAPGSEPTIPRAVDLSANFPVPGNQGAQGSCVGWATAYAIKSYFEKREIGWDLSRREHVFSPAFIFNSIALPGCEGSYPHEALDRLMMVGAATMDRMSYTDQECQTQPSAEALQQADNFRIQSWGTLRTVADMKAQLANRRPVLLGIQTYPSLNTLSGPDAVYNNFSGNPQGGHAVAITGYDDDRYGGAFRVINSWGANWGDGGYFWLPYSAISDPRVFMAAYSIEDRPNNESPLDPVDPPPPSPALDLPNLEVLTWSANYDPRPGGAGALEFEIANTGTTVAPAGAYVNLMLSLDERITGDDIFVIYEPIPFDLQPGGSAYRDAASALQFQFPDTLAPGTYLMAVWVDDLDSVTESNEDDNVTFGDLVQIENSLPDLVIDSWYAEWQFGAGSLTYEIINQGLGTASGGWDVNLMLSADDMLGNSDDLYLAYETTSFPLAPGESVYRDWTNPLTFSVDGVAPGQYLMALWADDLNSVIESNERNNESWGWEAVSFGMQGLALGSSPSEPSRQYNARRLPENAQVYRVSIHPDADGSPEMQVLGQASREGGGGPQRGKGEIFATKINSAANPRLFPVHQATPMP